MSFLGGLKKIGKGLLKYVAPVALNFIPGIGTAAGIALSGAMSAANKKIEGGSWKDSLKSGLIGAGTGAIGGGAIKGLGPSAKVAGSVGKGGKILNAAKNIGKGAIGIGDKGWQGALGSAIGDAVRGGGGQAPSGGYDDSGYQYGGGQQYGGNAMGYNSGGPNRFADALARGKNEAIMNQPFRSGYDIRTQGDDNSVITGHLPPIYPNYGPRPPMNTGPQMPPEEAGPAIPESSFGLSRPQIPAKTSAFKSIFAPKTTPKPTSISAFGRTFGSKPTSAGPMKVSPGAIEKRRIEKRKAS